MPQRRFSVCFYFHKDAYSVLPLHPVHPDVAEKAYRLIKRTGQGEVYDVRQADFGAECDCPGFQHWSHCKHVDMLVAFGCLPEQSAAARKGVRAAAPGHSGGSNIACSSRGSRHTVGRGRSRGTLQTTAVASE